MFYIFHGPDELSRAETLAKLKAQMGDPSLADLNTTILDGDSLTLGELQQVCDSLPFMSDRRLVIGQSGRTHRANCARPHREGCQRARCLEYQRFC